VKREWIMWGVALIASLSPVFGQVFSREPSSGIEGGTVGGLRETCLADRQVELDEDKLLDDDTMARAMWCYGYMRGYMGAILIHRRFSGEDEDALSSAEQINPAYCMENFVSAGQFVAVFMKWADDHPEKWQDKAELGLWFALGEAFCD